ncbi:MAG: hypothetical protein M1269_03420 [Chloroflexi bacterium]|nr:hypothetical protein [Chloroflexota bacterium]
MSLPEISIFIKVKVYSRYKIQALTPEPSEFEGTFQTASLTMNAQAINIHPRSGWFFFDPIRV